MKALFAAAALAGLLAAAGPALAADPSPSPPPKSLPIRGVTVDVQQNRESADMGGASHIEAPPFMAPPRQMRMAPSAMEAAPAPAAPAAKARGKAAAPAPSPSPSPQR